MENIAKKLAEQGCLIIEEIPGMWIRLDNSIDFNHNKDKEEDVLAKIEEYFSSTIDNITSHPGGVWREIEKVVVYEKYENKSLGISHDTIQYQVCYPARDLAAALNACNIVSRTYFDRSGKRTGAIPYEGKDVKFRLFDPLHSVVYQVLTEVNKITYAFADYQFEMNRRILENTDKDTDRSYMKAHRPVVEIDSVGNSFFVKMEPFES